MGVENRESEEEKDSPVASTGSVFVTTMVVTWGFTSVVDVTTCSWPATRVTIYVYVLSLVDVIVSSTTVELMSGTIVGELAVVTRTADVDKEMGGLSKEDSEFVCILMELSSKRVFERECDRL